MADRKNVMNDMRVIAAIANLQRAILSVNGDARISSLILMADIRIKEGEDRGLLVELFNVCTCPACIDRFEVEMAEFLADARKTAKANPRRTH